MSFNTSFLQVMNGAPADWAAADKLIPSGFIGRDSTTGVCRIGTGLPFSQSTLFFAPPIFRRLTSIFPSSSNVRANVTGAAFDCEAGRSYKIEINAIHQTAALTTGGSMGLVMPTGTGSIVGHQRSGISNLVVATETAAPLTAISSLSTLAGSFMSSPGCHSYQHPAPLVHIGCVHMRYIGQCAVAVGERGQRKCHATECGVEHVGDVAELIPWSR